MSMIDGIAGLSTAMSQVRVQNEVSTQVLKLAQNQSQPMADLVEAAMEDIQQILESMAGDLGGNLDMSL